MYYLFLVQRDFFVLLCVISYLYLYISYCNFFVLLRVSLPLCITIYHAMDLVFQLSSRA
jgi:hypothetical protein